jgi:hypothetical protein
MRNVGVLNARRRSGLIVYHTPGDCEAFRLHRRSSTYMKRLREDSTSSLLLKMNVEIQVHATF